MSLPLPDVAALFDEAPCGLLVTALDGTILQANTTFCTWLNLPREALVGQKRLQDLFTVGGRIFHQTHWVPSLQMQGSLAEVKFDVRRADGQTVPMILNARRRTRPEGDFDEIAAFVAQDRSLYERELMNARKKADAMLAAEQQSLALLRDRALFAEQMVGIVSHDLRNPLSAILMGIRLLGGGENDRRTRVLGHVRDSAERAQRLVAELLDFTQARVGSGLAVQLKPVNLHELTARTLRELRLAFPDHDLVHHSHGPGDCVADPDRLAQLIGNLVGNAAAYGEAGTPITVSSGVEGTTAALRVHNLGKPIDASILPVVFEPMVRGDTGSNTVRSVGLGLYIVNEIARAHGGRMEVSSSTDEGTSFVLQFPCGRAEPTPAD